MIIFATIKKKKDYQLNTLHKFINESYLVPQSMSLTFNPHPIMQIKIIPPKANNVASKRESGEYN